MTARAVVMTAERGEAATGDGYFQDSGLLVHKLTKLGAGASLDFAASPARPSYAEIACHVQQNASL